ncbi:MAG: HAD family hydrolase [Betaproteobacteria bacterium]|nr:HAD family hydrolase [Betaproteobacteria bacterium]
MNLIFDFDGTLIDSAPSILAGFAAVVERHGISPRVPLDSRLIGPPLLPTLQRISGVDDQTALQDMAATFKAWYDTEGYRLTAVYPGIDAVLHDLAARARLYIVTNKRIHPTRQILGHLGWVPLFAGVYAQDAFDPPLASKAAVIGQVLSMHGIDPAGALYIGDRAEDGEAATANGLRFAWATWGYGTDLDLSGFIRPVTLETPRILASLHDVP